MTLRPLYGHTALRQRLSAAAREGRLPASLLFQGSRGTGKQRLALWLGQYLLCDRALAEGLDAPCGDCQHCRYCERLAHPDLHWFFPRPRLKDSDASADEVKADLAEAKAERMAADGLWSTPSGSDALYVATIRALVQMASLRPAMARRAVFVVGDAERMVSQEGADQAANAFLKLLEEPPAATTIILTTAEPGSLLPTIRSRVVSLRVPPLQQQDMKAFLADSAVARRFAGTNESELLARAHGAPGMLMGNDQIDAAMKQARELLNAALAADSPDGFALRVRTAARQGSAGARGAFRNILEAMVLILNDRTHELVLDGKLVAARNTAAAIPLVESSIQKARGNASPQLLTASLLTELHRTLGS